MAPEDTWRIVTRGELAHASARFSFSYPATGVEETLQPSLKRFGLMRPLLCIEEAGTVTVAAGHRRLRVLETLGVEKAAVRIVPQASPPLLWDLLLEDQLIAGSLNPVEIGLYARRRLADAGESAEELAQRVLPRLGLAPKPEALEDSLWIAGLPDTHRQAFADARLPSQGVRILSRAPREDALAVLDLLSGVHVGVNKFSELVRWLLECAWGQGIRVDTWIRSEGLAPLAEDLESLRREVRRRRYPLLSEWEAAFAGDVRAAQLPDNVRITHSKNFEGGRLAFNTTFAELGELDRSLETVLGAVRSRRLDGLARYLS